jgi:Tol biopolymer transport system component
VLYTEDDNIVAYDLTTKHSTVIVGGFDGQLSVSPSGDRIAFDRLSEDERTDFIVTISIDPQTGKPTGPAHRVSVGGGDSPSFSPDGKLIAFAVEEPSPRTKNDLAVVLATGGPERVLAKYDKFINQTYWSADGEWIFVQIGERQSIERVPAAGGPSEAVISNSGEIDGSIDGQIAFYRPDACAQSEGRMAYVTASGARGEFMIPPGSHGQSSWSAQTLLTHTVGGGPTSTIYELDVSPILRAIGKH